MQIFCGMGMSIPQSAKLLFQFDLVRVRITVQPKEVNIQLPWLSKRAIDVISAVGQIQAWSISILVGIEEDICAVIFVVA